MRTPTSAAQPPCPHFCSMAALRGMFFSLLAQSFVILFSKLTSEYNLSLKSYNARIIQNSYVNCNSLVWREPHQLLPQARKLLAGDTPPASIMV